MAAVGEAYVIRSHAGYDPLAEGGDPPAPPAPTCWQRWRGRAVSLAAAAGSIALRVGNLSPVANMLGSVGAGACAAAAISSSRSVAQVAKIRRLTGNVCGYMTFFALSQLFAVYYDRDAEYQDRRAIILRDLTMAVASAGLETVLRRFWAKRVVREESVSRTRDGGALLSPREMVPEPYASTLKVAAAWAAAWVYYADPDPVVRGLASFGTGFYLSQVAGERVMAYLNSSIRRQDTAEGSEGETRCRTIKAALTTLSYFKFLALVPWTSDPASEERLAQLGYVALALGFLDGVGFQAVRDRLKHVVIPELDELQVREDRSLFNEIVWPALSTTGVVTFVIWQDRYVLQNENDRRALGAMLGAYLGTLGAAKFVDWRWDPMLRNRTLDTGISFFSSSPRVFGVHPFYLFAVGMNCLKINGQAIAQEQSPSHEIVSIAAWGAGGAAMANELARSSSKRNGSMLADFPLVLVTSLANTIRLAATGYVK